MKHINKLILFLSIFILGFNVHAESGIVNIECGAPGYVGKEVKVYQINDYISRDLQVVASGKVGTDSVFNTSFSIDQTRKLLIRIDHVEAPLYVAPNSSYDVYFPKSTLGGGHKLGGNEVQLYFFNLDTSDVNYKILNFHSWMDDFFAENSNLRIVDKSLYRAKFDTLTQYAYDFYKTEEDDFVRTYVTYYFAQMEQLSISRKDGDRKVKNFSRYFRGQKIRYQNDAFMNFFNAYFKNIFGELNYKVENRVFLASLKSSPTLMLKAMSEDYRLRSKQLSELILLRSIKQKFYSGDYPQSNLINVLDSIHSSSMYPEHREIAASVKKVLTVLKPGYPAPQLRLKVEKDSIVSWRTFKGKYVYLNFFETWSETAEKEMNLYPDLRDKYGGDIEFVSICLDKDSSNLAKYLEKHPNYNWNFYNIGDSRDLIDRFEVKSVPSYFLIDQEGYLVAAPALSPSPNGKYETIDKTFFYIRKALHPEKTFKVGQLDD